MTIPLHEPSFDKDDEDLVLDALRSTWVSTGGPYVQTFEREFAAFVGSRHAVSVSNGTVALQLCLETLKRQRGVTGSFIVIVPSLSFIATSNAVLHAGGRPHLVDCAPGSLNCDPDLIKSVIVEQFRYDKGSQFWVSTANGLPLLAVMPAHIMGWTCDMNRLHRELAELRVPLVEDAAEALASRYADGSHVGLTGIASAFSFNGNKIMTTGGGGMIVTNDDAFASRAKHLSTTAKTDGLRYVHDESGYNHRMVNILAALGVAQLRKLPTALARKKAINELYREKLQGSGIRLHEESCNESNCWIVNVQFQTENQREAAMKHLLNEDVQCRPLWTPAHHLPFIAELQPASHRFPSADSMWKTTLSLPSSPGLKVEQVAQICSLLKESTNFHDNV